MSLRDLLHSLIFILLWFGPAHLNVQPTVGKAYDAVHLKYQYIF